MSSKGKENIPWVYDLLEWYRSNKRKLPWRKNKDPYRIWLSEVMLQQTQVDTVIPYYKKFLLTCPTVDVLAKTQIDTVLKLWEGLGYYSRARNLHRTAVQIVNEFNSQFPESFSELKKLPGIGPYIAAAVSSIAFCETVPVVDGNVLRVFARFWADSSDIRQQKVRTKYFHELISVIPEDVPGDFNQAIMELGALVCRPKDPKCEICPINSECRAFRMKKTDKFPFKSPRKKTPHYNVAVGVVWRKGKILIAQRREDQMLGGLWEFPGGKMKKGESPELAVERELIEECNLTVTTCNKICTIKHAYSHFRITMTAVRCQAPHGRAIANVAQRVKWVNPADFKSYAFPAANLKIIERIDKN